MPFVANTDAQRAEMLAEMGLTMEDLFADIPPQLQHKAFNLPAGLTEQQVRDKLAAISANNMVSLTCFLGGGFYDHFIPAAVGALISRSEFYSAYTPYQPELSQGTLQAVYEYQSSICRITGMDVSNASLYDGGTALYEAMVMALSATRRGKIIMDTSVNPIYRMMIRSYTENLSIDLVELPCEQGMVDRAAYQKMIDDDTAAVIVQNPNFFGCVDDFTDLAELAHRKGALMLMSCYPIALGILKTPGEMNADIVTGEGQSLGIPMSFGGPYLGYIGATQKLARKLPGRIVGQTVDKNDKRAFVLTLQAREQHIRRDKATSNICTNQALCALMAQVYMSLVGKQGLPAVAQLCADKAQYAFERLTAIPGVTARFEGQAFFNEFVLDLPREAGDVVGKLIAKGFAAGFPLSRYYDNMENALLVCVTEKRSKEDIGMLAEALESVL